MTYIILCYFSGSMSYNMRIRLKGGPLDAVKFQSEPNGQTFVGHLIERILMTYIILGCF